MKCNNCGQEFGPGLTCQNCGTDRVAGLAGFSKGSFPSNGTAPHAPASAPAESNQVLCWNCGEVIPKNSKFCPFCGKETTRTCPNCGHKFSSQYPICPECGSNYKETLERIEKESVQAAEDEERSYAEFLEFLESSDLVLVEGGAFQMGATPEQQASSFLSDRKPVHTVSIDTFILSKHPVTQRLWTSVMGYNPSRFVGEDNPVENVTLQEVYDFIKAAQEQFDMPFRLPTEAEWEFAARGGVHSRGYMYPGGNNLDELGWVKFNSGRQTHPVGLKKPNELGLYDMVGNVFEFVEDVYDSKYYSKSPVDNPCNTKQRGEFSAWLFDSYGENVVRGCSYYFDGKYATSSYRYYVPFSGKDDNLGFRLAIEYPRDSFPNH